MKNTNTNSVLTRTGEVSILLKLSWEKLTLVFCEWFIYMKTSNDISLPVTLSIAELVLLYFVRVVYNTCYCCFDLAARHRSRDPSIG